MLSSSFTDELHLVAHRVGLSTPGAVSGVGVAQPAPAESSVPVEIGGARLPRFGARRRVTGADSDVVWEVIDAFPSASTLLSITRILWVCLSSLSLCSRLDVLVLVEDVVGIIDRLYACQASVGSARIGGSYAGIAGIA